MQYIVTFLFSTEIEYKIINLKHQIGFIIPQINDFRNTGFSSHGQFAKYFLLCYNYNNMYLVTHYTNRALSGHSMSGVKIFDVIPSSVNNQFKIRKMEEYIIMEDDKACFKKIREKYFSKNYKKTCFFAKSI